MGAYGSPEMHPKLQNNNTTQKRHKEVVGIKRYTKNDEIPMTYFYIYIFVKFPFNMLLPVLLSLTTWLSSGTMFYFTLTSLAEAIACIGIYARKYWGYMFNKIYIIISGIWCVLLLFVALFTEFDSLSAMISGVGYCSCAVALHIFSYIYFEKRKIIFTK